MNTIYKIAKDALENRGFTHLLAADGTKTPLSVLAYKQARHPFPRGWAYVDRDGKTTVSHYTNVGKITCRCNGYYLLIKE